MSCSFELVFPDKLQLTCEHKINKKMVINTLYLSVSEFPQGTDKDRGEQRKNILRMSEKMCEHLYARVHLLVHMQEKVETSKRDEDGRRLQSGISTVIVPEAALSGTIPRRPPDATATAGMPVPQDIHCEMIQSELSE